MKEAIHFSRRLNDADAKFFFMGRRRECNVAMVMLAVLARELSRDELIDALTPHLEEIPRFADYLRPSPLNIAPPIWMPVPREERNPDYYVQEIEMPSGSGWRDVLARVDAIQSVAFPDRTVWRIVLINGVPGGGSVVVMKVHHALSDGMALTLLFARVFAGDVLAEANALIDVVTEPPLRASRLRLALGHWGAAFGQWLRHAARSLPAMIDGERRRLEADAMKRALRPPQRWPLSAHRPARRLAGFRVPTETWRAEARARKGGVNDLYLALVARIMRRSFDSLDFDAKPLRIAMPVGIRRGRVVRDGHNTAAIGIVELAGRPNELDDLTEVRRRAKAARADTDAVSPTLVEETLKLLPGALRAAIEFRRASGYDVLASNVPIPLEGKLAGISIERMFMVAPAIGQAVSFSLTSYRDYLYLASNSDCGITPSSLEDRTEETLADVFDDRFERLGEASP